MDMLQTVYQHGVRIEIDPTREDDEVIGPVVTFEERKTHNPYTPMPQIVFNWKKGFLTFDPPAVSALTGLLANYGDKVTFSNGMTLSNVKIVNPPDIFDPVGDGKNYIAFALYTQDGKPLAETRRAALSLVSASFNTGFEIGTGKAEPNKPPSGAKAGGLPVLVPRVGATVEAPTLDGMTCVLRDWHLRDTGSGRIDVGKLEIPADKPIFFNAPGAMLLGNSH